MKTETIYICMFQNNIGKEGRKEGIMNEQIRNDRFYIVVSIWQQSGCRQLMLGIVPAAKTN